MSFRCQVCGKAKGDRRKPISVVVEKRVVNYPQRRDKHDEIIDKGGVGYETVREIQTCLRCATDAREQV